MSKRTVSDLIWLVNPKDLQVQKSWLEKDIKKIGEKQILNLVKLAVKQSKLSYSPYSKYPVGVALLAKSDKIYLGNNVEKVSYSDTDHAEEAAVTGAVVSQEIKKSGRKFIKALAVAQKLGISPCGRCRQIIGEHCDNAVIINCDLKGKIYSITSLQNIFPDAFTPTLMGF
ncbi:cytidine deaminase [Candidatus Gottesmanbacteria bacterium]|nr:cytidine deaminase [Candidatus Gottesmanbacteria bacterium]